MQDLRVECEELREKLFAQQELVATKAQELQDSQQTNAQLMRRVELLQKENRRLRSEDQAYICVCMYI